MAAKLPPRRLRPHAFAAPRTGGENGRIEAGAVALADKSRWPCAQ